MEIIYSKTSRKRKGDSLPDPCGCPNSTPRSLYTTISPCSFITLAFQVATLAFMFVTFAVIKRFARLSLAVPRASSRTFLGILNTRQVAPNSAPLPKQQYHSSITQDLAIVSVSYEKTPRFRQMSQSHLAASSSNFQLIINNALKAYEKRTKNDLLAHPLAAQPRPAILSVPFSPSFNNKSRG